MPDRLGTDNAPSPAALHKLRVQRERAGKEKAQ